jgi:hypothetical protein
LVKFGLVLLSSTSLVGHVGTKDPSLAGKHSEIWRKEILDVTAKLRKEEIMEHRKKSGT